LVLSESAAILVYLEKKSSRMIPGDRAGEAQVMRRCFAAMNSVEPPLLSLLVLDWTADGGWQLRQAPGVPGRLGESSADEPGALVR
jgi:glutathione S-transferase